MKKVVLNWGILLLGFIFFNAIPDANSQDHKLTRKERLDIRKAENISSFESVNSLIESKKFFYILDETKIIVPPWQRREMPKLPYVMMIDSSYAYIYWDSPYHIKEGNIENWNLRKDLKKLCFYLQFKITGPNPFWDMDFYFTINADNSAHVRIESMEGENSGFTFPKYGRIIKIDSLIFRNQNLTNY